MATSSWARPLLAAAILGAATTAALAADKLAVLSEGGASAYWRPVAETIAVPAYPGIIADKSEDVCIGVGYLLNPDGSTSDFALLNAWGSKAGKAKADDPRFTAFAQNSLAAVQRWKFASTAAAGTKIKPVYTAATFAFSSNPTADVASLKGNCVIADLSDFIAKAQADAYRRRGNLDKGRMDRQRAEQPPLPVNIGISR
jgi:hypothetical protein